MIFSIKSVGGYLYKKGFNCTEDTFAAIYDSYGGEVRAKRYFRKAKLICFEKIYGKSYNDRRSKELEREIIKTRDYLNSTKFTEESSERFKNTLKKTHLYNIWAFLEYRSNRYPEGSHFDADKYEKYLEKIKDRKLDGSENLLKLMREDAQELGF